MSDQPVQRKICILGDFAVGKTSLVRRYVEGIFDDRYLSTIGVKISRRIVKVDENRNVHLIIWDVAGSEEFDGKHLSYLRGAAAALLVCDLTRASTLPHLETYIAAMRSVEPQARFIVLANKSDLVEQFELKVEEVAAFAESMGTPWLITSAKTGSQVEEAFNQVAVATIER